LCDVFAGYLCGRLLLHLSSKISKSRIETEVVCGFHCSGQASKVDANLTFITLDLDLTRYSVVNADAL
jgi:hypothetical protein